MTLPRLALAALLALFTASAASADDWVYFGTYTGGKGFAASKGIYRSKFETATGKLGQPELAAEMGSPSFLAIHPNGKFLYAVGEGGGKDGGPVVAFSLDAKTGALTKLNEDKSGGSGPCHISVHPKGTHAVVANYGGGSCSIFKVNDDGKLSNPVFFQHKGSGPNTGRQKEPHAHCGFFTPDGRSALVVDLGIDRVKVFQLDAIGGVSNDEAKDIVTPPGSGPRHIAIAPDGKFAYVCGELDSTANVIDLGSNKVVQSLSTLPAPHKGNSTAECILHPNGKFVYVSNRGHNSIAVFKVGEDRKLTAAGHIKGEIKTPRNFNIDPSGKWMLIASQDGDGVGVWELDPNTGMGKETGNAVVVGRPVCVKFVPVAK
ncbi:MAG TPA: lactonase family protein [Gemmataceae bacterium]|nr:lactonase family protein [Gemmataceae bacterium]